MPVTQTTTEKVVLRLYAVGTDPKDAFFNGFDYPTLGSAIHEQQKSPGTKVFTTVKELSFSDIEDVTPKK